MRFIQPSLARGHGLIKAGGRAAGHQHGFKGHEFTRYHRLSYRHHVGLQRAAKVFRRQPNPTPCMTLRKQDNCVQARRL
jgi:hypothetical protein